MERIAALPDDVVLVSRDELATALRFPDEVLSEEEAADDLIRAVKEQR